MGATASSAQRDGRCEEDAAAEELAAAAGDARDDGDAADDKLLQNNGQISSLNVKTKSHADEIIGQVEETALADVGSGFVTLKEDGTETIEDLQHIDTLLPNTISGNDEMGNEVVTVKEEPEVDSQENDINEVGFKKIFKFAGFKFTLKKDTCEKTETNEEEERVVSDSNDTQEISAGVAIENIPETHITEGSSQPDAAEPSQQTENKPELDEDIKTVENNEEDTPDKELAKEASPEPEEPMSPIKQFFTQGIFASLRKKKKEEEIQKESKEEELKSIETIGAEEAEKEDSKCMCLEIPYIISEEEKDSQEKSEDKLSPEGELQNILEKDKVQGSPFKRLFQKFSTRRQRESKATEKLIEAEEQVSEQPKPSSELAELGKTEEPEIGEPKPAEDELVTDVSPQESKKKSETTVSWEALICGGAAKKRARKTNEDESGDKGDEYEKTTDSPLGSSVEGDYDQLISSNEQTGSPAEGEQESTWKTFKKMVTPKRKVRTGESSTPEQVPSDSEMSKDESFSIKKLIPGHKKRKSDARQDQPSSDEAAKDHETGDEDDETPAIIPLSEYEIIEPESLKEMNEQRVEITIEHQMPEMTSQVLDKDTSNELVPKIVTKVLSSTGQTVIQALSEEFEELTDFVSKHQQLSDIPEEGIIEESIETPVSSAEWTTQDDTLAEDIVELTADAVTAPEPESEQFTGDDTTEMVSAVSQLTESPRTSGHVTPVPAEHSIQTFDVILQEAVQSISMAASVQSVTTKDESRESLAMSFSPYIVESSKQEETTVLIAHKKADATAICTGLVSEEMESVEKQLPASLVEAVPEISDAVPTELVSDNFKDEPEVAGLGTDEVYEAKIKELKTEYQEIILNKDESVTEQDFKQVIHLEAEPLVKESEETHMEEKTDECIIELRQVIDTMQIEKGPEAECPLNVALEEPVYEQSVVVEAEEKLPDVAVSAAEFEQAVVTEEVNSLPHAVVDNILDITTSKASDVPEEDIEIIATTLESLETKETVGLISDHIKAETLALEDIFHIKGVQSRQDNVCERLVDVKDAVLLEADSVGNVEDIIEKMKEECDGKMAQLEIKEMHLEEMTEDVVTKVVLNVESEHISEPVGESVDTEQLPVKEVLLPDAVEVREEAIDTDLGDNKMKDNERTDRIFVNEEEELAVKGQPLITIEYNETDNQGISDHTDITDGSSKINVDAEMVEEIRIHKVVEFSEDVFEHKETPSEPEASCEVMLTPQQAALPEVEGRPVPIEMVTSQAEESSQDSKHPEPKQNEQPVTENIKTGKVLEMVAIIESTAKPSVKDKSIVAEPVTLVKSEAIEKVDDASEMTAAIDGDQPPTMISTEKEETDVPEEKYTLVIVPELKPEQLDSGLIVTEVAAVTLLAQNCTDTQIEISDLSKQVNETAEDTNLKCESLEQSIKMAIELQVEKAEITDETPAPQPLKSEVTPEVTVSEIQTQVVSELRAETLEVTEPEVEMPVETDVKVETAVVTQLEVEKPVVTSVVTELEVETPVVTSMAKITDSQNSAVTSQNQNIDTDTSAMTTENKEKVVEKPSVISVVVTPATPLDEVTPVVMLGNEDAETPSVESVIVRTAIAPVPEIQNVIPVVATPVLSSVIVTEVASPVEAEAAVISTVVETPVDPVTAVKSTPPVGAEMPVMVEKITVCPVAETPVDQTPNATEETQLSKVTETPVVSITSVQPSIALTVTEAVSSVTKSVVTQTVSAITAETVAVSIVETPTVTPAAVAETEPVIPLVEKNEILTESVADTPVVKSSQVVTPEVQTPDQAPQVAGHQTSASISVVETSESAPVSVVETPVMTPSVHPPGQVSTTVKETAPLADDSVITAPVETPFLTSTPVSVIETPVVTPVVDTPVSVSVTGTSSAVVVLAVPTAVGTDVAKSAPVSGVDTPDVSPVVETLDLVSMRVTETLPPVDVSVVTTAIETPAVIPVVDTPVLKSFPVLVTETPIVTQVVQTTAPVSVSVTETPPPVVASAVTTAIETPVVIPVVETTVVKSFPVPVIETPIVTPVVQTKAPVPVSVIETPPPVVVSAVTTAVQTPVGIPVVETPVVKSTSVSVVETPVLTPVVQPPSQISMMAKETEPPVNVSVVTAPVELPIVKSTPVTVAETPVVTPVVQTPVPVPVTVKETLPLVAVSAVTTAVETPAIFPVVETPLVKSTPVAETSSSVSVSVTETPPPVVVSAVTAAVETPNVIPVIETPVVKSIPVEVFETPVVTPVVETPVSVKATESSPPVAVSAVTTTSDTPTTIPLVQTPVSKSTSVGVATDTPPIAVVSAVTSTVETSVVKSTPVGVVETSVVTSVVETPGPVSVIATETSPPVVVPAEKSAVIPAVETPVVKSTPAAVVKTPVVTPVVHTPCQVFVTVAETPVVGTPGVNPTLAETPVVTPVMMTPTMTPIIERSLVSLVVETTIGTSTSFPVTDRPIRIPVVQTPALVSVIVKETSPPIVLPAMTTAPEFPVFSPVVETVKPTMAEVDKSVPVVPVPEAPAVTPAVQTRVVGQVSQTPKAPAMSILKASPVVTVMDTSAVTTVEKAQLETQIAEKAALAPETPTLAPAVRDVAREVNEAMSQAVEEEKKEVKSESSVVLKDAGSFVAAKAIQTSTQENPKGSLQDEPVVTSTELQSEVEEDVWEDAVDNIGESQGLMAHTDGALQDTAAKQDAAI